jgi:putative tryptophan/tyrosine transport system substrate-binding protein
LAEKGFVEGQNLAIEYRWAEGHSDRLPGLAMELVQRQITVIAATGGTASALAAKSATETIPIVFTSADDPVKTGLVASFNHPGGNVTGVTWFGVEAITKRTELLHQLVPNAVKFALLLDPSNPESETAPVAVKNAIAPFGGKLILLSANDANSIDAAFSTLLEQGAQALVISSSPFFVNERAQIIKLAAEHAVPTVHAPKDATEEGALMSYGNSLTDAYRRDGVYVGRILKGEKPGDLPIDRSTKFEFVINIKTAKALGLTIPSTVFALADEVIE